MTPTDTWLGAVDDMPPLTGTAGTAGRLLLLLLHYGVAWDSWVGRHRATYWDHLLPDRTVSATYLAGTMRARWALVSTELDSGPRNPAERAELEQLLRADPVPVLTVIRDEATACCCAPASSPTQSAPPAPPKPPPRSSHDDNHHDLDRRPDRPHLDRPRRPRHGQRHPPAPRTHHRRRRPSPCTCRWCPATLCAAGCAASGKSFCAAPSTTKDSCRWPQHTRCAAADPWQRSPGNTYPAAGYEPSAPSSPSSRPSVSGRIGTMSRFAR